MQALARFDQEVDDLGELDVQQWWQLRARPYDRIEIDCGSDEVSAQVSRTVTNGVAFNQRTLDEVRRR
jgi:hypothetical protein